METTLTGLVLDSCAARELLEALAIQQSANATRASRNLCELQTKLLTDLLAGAAEYTFGQDISSGAGPAPGVCSQAQREMPNVRAFALTFQAEGLDLELGA